MSIRIVNLKNYKLNENEVLIKVDRTSPVGNIFIMHNESERDEVCDKYDEYFNKARHIANTDFLDYLRRIYVTAKKQDVALGCWCYPKRCHAETIKNFIEEALS